MSFPFLPPRASDFADKTDPMFYVLVLLSAFFTVLVFTLLVFFAVRYRKQNTRVNRSGKHDHAIGPELTWTIIPLLMGLAMFVWAALPYGQAWQPPANAIQIYVVGKRWMWHIQHENGVREMNELHIPVGKPVAITIISQDVIHGFYVPAFRIKRDAIPGRYNQMWFTPTVVGKYHFFCTEFCGTDHSRMRGFVTVMTPHDYAVWLSNGGEEVKKAHETMEDRGERLYTQLACGNCHDADGTGRGPSLADLYGSKVLLTNGSAVKADESFLRNVLIEPSDQVAAGYQQVMPSYKDQLTEEQILEMIAYIKTLHAAPANNPAGATGTAIPAPAGQTPTGNANNSTAGAVVGGVSQTGNGR